MTVDQSRKRIAEFLGLTDMTDNPVLDGLFYDKLNMAMADTTTDLLWPIKISTIGPFTGGSISITGISNIRTDMIFSIRAVGGYGELPVRLATPIEAQNLKDVIPSYRKSPQLAALDQAQGLLTVLPAPSVSNPITQLIVSHGINHPVLSSANLADELLSGYASGYHDLVCFNATARLAHAFPSDVYGELAKEMDGEYVKQGIQAFNMIHQAGLVLPQMMGVKSRFMIETGKERAQS